MGQKIEELKIVAMDEQRPIEERRQAAKHICTLLGESPHPINGVPESDLKFVVAAFSAEWPGGIDRVSLQDAVHVIAGVRYRKRHGTGKQ